MRGICLEGVHALKQDCEGFLLSIAVDAVGRLENGRHVPASRTADHSCILEIETWALVLQVSFVLASQFLLKYLSLTAARWLHNSMLKQLLRSVTFETNVTSMRSYPCRHLPARTSFALQQGCRKVLAPHLAVSA